MAAPTDAAPTRTVIDTYRATVWSTGAVLWVADPAVLLHP